MAAAEMLKRMDAADQLIKFTEYTLPSYRPAEHHRLIAKKLEAVERGEIDRLIICMPPRHGKSELASRRFPAWYLGRHPGHSVIAASYNSDLASDFGREVRNIVSGPEFGCIFDTTLRADSSAANRWHTDAGGMYVAAGVGTAVTGRGADILLIDDPIKDREEADSELKRQKIWDWYTSTAYTRLHPGGRIVVIQTRWNEDDLAGRLLATNEDNWEVLELPALSDDGSALWPDFYPANVLNRIRTSIGPRNWSALYQQRPAPEEGDFFKREWLRPVNQLPDPKTLRVYGGSDYAVTADGGDYTVHVIVGLDPDDRMYLLAVWRGQTDSSVWVEAFCDLVEHWKPIGWAEENGQIKSGVGPFLTRRMRERKTFVHREAFPTRGDKAVRAQSIRGRMSLNGLYYLSDVPWFPALEAELLSFPAGKHDDVVDALGLVGQLLDKMVSGARPKTKRPDVDRWDRIFARQDSNADGESWKAY